MNWKPPAEIDLNQGEVHHALKKVLLIGLRGGHIINADA